MSFGGGQEFVKNSIELPIDQLKRTILYSLESSRVLIIVGETGSGKSTRLPEILFSAGIYNTGSVSHNIKTRMICITQPRRIAAIQLAQRVSDNLGCQLGKTVGYAIRFVDVSDADQTSIKFITDGLLIRELINDPLLLKYSVIIIDEVHERNLNTDLLLGMLKCVLARRKDLRIIISSATLDVDVVRDFFVFDEEFVKQDASLSAPTVLSVEGRTYKTKIYYREYPVANYLEASIETVINIHEANRLASGKILVFLTGQDEIEYVCERLSEYATTSSSRLDLKKLIVLPLHASLKPEDTSKVFKEYSINTRVCIVSTNVAETSLTVEGVAFVVDSGFTKLKIHDQSTGIDSLVRVPISKSSAKQRAGRAGRTRDGTVLRLYSKSEYDKMEESTVPEIQRSSLLESIMMLKLLGVDNLRRFPLISPMPRKNLTLALDLLHTIDVIDDSGELTEVGQKMAHFSLDPKISRILVSSEMASCTLEACRLAAMLQVKEIFTKQGKNVSSLWSNSKLTSICATEGDLPTYVNILNGFINNQKSQKWAQTRFLNYQALLNASEISKRLESQLRRIGTKICSSNGRIEVLQRSVLAGLFPNSAYLHPCGDYRTVKGDQLVHIHPTSVLSEVTNLPKTVVFVEILHSTKSYMRHLMAVESDWLTTVAPHYYSFATDLEMMRNNG